MAGLEAVRLAVAMVAAVEIPSSRRLANVEVDWLLVMGAIGSGVSYRPRKVHSRCLKPNL
jgi:hypothetical protein